MYLISSSVSTDSVDSKLLKLMPRLILLPKEGFKDMHMNALVKCFTSFSADIELLQVFILCYYYVSVLISSYPHVSCPFSNFVEFDTLRPRIIRLVI